MKEIENSTSGKMIALAICFFLLFTVSNAQVSINGGAPIYSTITAAVAAASPGDIIEAAPGVYNENVLINKNNLTLRSSGGKAVTTIQGITPTSGSAAVQLASGTNGVTIGQAGKGFTIIGVDGNGAIESAAIYLLGAHSNITIEGNEIRANGDHGLLSNYNAAIDGVLVKGNEFTGQTFMGPTPGDCGFGTQFNVGNNVPRQLVTMGGGPGVTNTKNISFINNLVTGTAGGYNGVGSCATTGQGNNLVTIDVVGCTISGNTFDGITTGNGSSSLRTRGLGSNIFCNTFRTTSLGAYCINIFLGSANPLVGAMPNTLAGIASSNSFPDGGAYLTPNNAASYVIYKDLAQASAAAALIGAGQTAVAAASGYNCPVVNLNTGLSYLTIQAAINAPATVNGHTISISPSTFNENVNVTKGVTLQGAGNTTILTPATACGGNGITISANNVRVNNLKVTNYTYGIVVVGSNVILDGVESVANCNSGIELGNGISNLMVKNSMINNNVSVGIRAGTGAQMSGITIDNCEVKGNNQGTSIAAVASGIVVNLFDNISIKNSDFSNNKLKGMYFEKLSNAVIENVIMNNSGTDPGYNNNNGIDINLKNGNYANITIRNSAITNCGVNGTAIDPEAAAAITIKARDDASSYNSFPATLNNVTVVNNIINGPQNGLRLGEYGKTNLTPTNVQVHENSFSGPFANKALINRTPVTTNATCNWYGITSAGVAALISGPVTYTPFLSNGTDNSPSIGFQPVPNSCTGCLGGSVTNINTSEVFCSIQAAINATATVNGHTLNVGPGTYNENLTINKSLTLIGANENIACGSRETESVIAPASGVPVTITADGVTLNGFEITAPSSTYAISGSGRSNQTIIFNNIHDIGTALTSGNVHAYLYNVSSSPSAATNVTVSDNCFTNISSASLTGSSASAIGILQSLSTGTLTGLNIERNTINQVNVNTGLWPSGKIAYGIQLNTGSAGYQTTTGKIVNAVIRSNEVTNLSGHISTGIGLEGNTENAVVENNSVANLSGTKTAGRSGGGYDLNGLKIESNRYVGTVTVRNNSFQTNTFTHSAGSGFGYAVANYVPSSLGIATLNCNWYGTNVYNDIVDNVTLTGKIFNKDLCQTIFAPYLISGTDSEPTTIGFQTTEVCTSCALALTTSSTAANFPANNDGTVSVSVSGGSGTYTYSWNTVPVQTGATATGLAAGMYTVIVTDVNGCQATAQAVVNVNATALNFDGNNDFVLINNNPSTKLSNGTVEGWIKTANAGSSFRGIIVKQLAYGLFLHNNQLVVYDWTVPGIITTGVSLNDNQWHHIAFSFQHGVVNGSHLYIDGILKKTFTYHIQSQTVSLVLGQGAPSGQSQAFLGNLDEVRIWNRALCQGEIQNNISCGLNPVGQTGLVALYQLDQGFINANNSGTTTATDASGNGNNGTLTNFALTGSSSNWVAGTVGGTCTAFVPPSATITPGGATTFCSGGSVTLTASSGDSYLWSNGETTQSINVTSSGSYTVAVTINGCSATSSPVIVTVNPLPVCSINGSSEVCPLNNASFSAPAGMSSYSWSVTGAGTIPGSSTSSSVMVLADGVCGSSYTITLIVTNSNGCSTSCIKTVTIEDNIAPTLTVPADITLQCGDPLPLLPINVNSSPVLLDGTYIFGTAVFGPALSATPITGNIELASPADACLPITNNFTGKIAVIDRAGCAAPPGYFTEKVLQAQNAGAIAVIIVNNVPGDGVATMGAPPGPLPAITIPSVMVSNNYGNSLKSAMLAGTVNVSLSASEVSYSDNCSASVLTYSELFIPGSCSGNYQIQKTWTATDQCGNATTASQTITVQDITAPTLTVPANITLECNDPLPLAPLNINSSPNNLPSTYNVGTANFGAPLTSTPLTADAVMVIDDAGNPYDACENITNDLTGKIAVIERSGCQPPAGYFVNKAFKAQTAGAVGVIFIFNAPGDQVANMGLPAGPNPAITIPLMLVSNTYGNTLKASILSGPVNVSMSAPTVIASDACSFVSITHQQVFTAGNCQGNYTLLNTWTATDQCGNATTASQTITVQDITAPTLTVPANVTLECNDPLPLAPLNINSSPNNLPSTYNVGTAVFGAPLTATPLTANAVMVIDDAGNPYDACENITNNLTGKIAVIERSGCQPPTGYFVNKAFKAQAAGAVGVIFIFNTPGDQIVNMGLPPGPNPTITIPLMLVSNNYGNALKASILSGPVNVSLSARTVIATDNCSFPVITLQTTTVAGCSPCNYTIVRTWTATDQCGNATSASQTITVTDNNTNYIIYAKEEAKFGEYNNIGGDVGVTALKGKADFKKYDVLNPFTVTAKEIKVDLPSSVNNRVYAPASGGPAPTFMGYNGSTSGLSNIDVVGNGTLNGNWKDVKVKKGVIATLTGNNFGKITIEEGAKVTFTAAVINMEELKVQDGKKNVNTTDVLFTNPTMVKVKDKVTVEDDTRVNVNGPKLTFHVGKNYGGNDGNFDVKGENVQITANIIIPKGKLKMGNGKAGRETVMTGWYVIEKLDAGNYVNWNKYVCTTSSSRSLFVANDQPALTQVPEVPIIQLPADKFEVKVFPNPTDGAFNIQVITTFSEQIMCRILDVNGKVVHPATRLTKQALMNLSNVLPGGIYFVEVTQGKNRSLTKLIKLN